MKRESGGVARTIIFMDGKMKDLYFDDGFGILRENRGVVDEE